MMTNILLCGVGGQGVLLAAKLIAFAAFHAGHRVCANEIHGMAQRGGSVTATVRFGNEVGSPLFPDGQADILFALEHAEALRHAHTLKPGGQAVIAARSVIPITVTTGAAVYPADIEARIRKVFPRAVYADASAAAAELGSGKLVNTWLLGIVSRSLPEIPADAWSAAIDSVVRPELAPSNHHAFETGRTA